MATVPRVEGPSVQQAGIPDAYQRAPAALGGADQARAQQINLAGNAMANYAQAEQRQRDIDDQARVDGALNLLAERDTDLSFGEQGFTKLRGEAALKGESGRSPVDDFVESFDKTARELENSLGNDRQKRLFALRANDLGTTFRRRAVEHMGRQQDAYNDQQTQGAIDVFQRRMALAWTDPETLAQSENGIREAVKKAGVRAGAPAEAIDAATAKALSPAHVGVMKAMIRAGSADVAAAYYAKVKPGLTEQAIEHMDSIVQPAVDAKVGDSAVDAVWQAIGPKGINDAVKTFDMSRELSKTLKDSTSALKHAQSELVRRAQLFNAQQTEANNASINAVFEQINSGTPMPAVRRSSAWMDLPPAKQHEITKGLAAEASAAEARAMQADARRDRQMLLGNGDAYLRVSDPDVLYGIKDRNAIIAMRTAFGYEGTQHLLQRWEALQKPGALPEARMDQDAFNSLAAQFGFHPFKANSEDRKEELGELKARTEALIDAAQRTKGSALTHPEKVALMSGEMTRTVRVKRLLGDKNLPVIMLSAEDAADVVIPKAEVPTLRDQMAKLFALNGNPDFEDTPQNLQRYYLSKVSAAAKLIPKKAP